MALKWIDGFEQYGANDAAPSGIEEVYPSNNGVVNFFNRAGRLTGAAMQLRISSGTAFMTTQNLGNMATVIVGFAYMPMASLNAGVVVELREDDNATQGINVRLNADGTLTVLRGVTTIASTAAVITADVWHYIELKVTVAEAGAYELRVNGTNVLSNGSVDTRAGTTNNYANRVRWAGPSGATTIGNKIDDAYICDATGTVNNDFLGDRKVLTIFPTADTADEDFATSAGTDSFELVNDDGLDDDSTYVESATSTDRDLFDFGNVGGLATINGIQHNVIARKTDVTNFDIDLVTKSGATTDVAASQTVGSTSYGHFFRVQEDDPNTTDPWTGTNLDAAQFGFDVG